MRPMIHTYLNRGLVLTATLLLASSASADTAPGKASANHGGKADTKAEAKVEKAEAKVEKTAAGLADKTDKKEEAKPSDRAARRAAQHEAQKEKLRGMLKAPMDEAQKQELRRHAERVAKLERIKALAVESKDKDIAEKAGKLLEKETARHEKFLATAAKVEAKTAAPGAAAAEGKPVAPGAADDKGGAK